MQTRALVEGYFPFTFKETSQASLSTLKRLEASYASGSDTVTLFKDIINWAKGHGIHWTCSSWKLLPPKEGL